MKLGSSSIKRLSFEKFIVLCIFVGMIANCGYGRQMFSGNHNLEDDRLALKQGYAALEKGDPEAAQAIFEELKNNSSIMTIKRRAHYGLAVAQFLASQDETQHQAAIATWHQWRDSYPVDENCEDPRVLEPLVICPDTSAPKLWPMGEAACKGKVPGYLHDELRGDFQRLQQHVLQLEKTISQLKTEKQQLKDAKNKEIQLLKEKIKALEAIDQNIEKKKNEISSPQ